MAAEDERRFIDQIVADPGDPDVPLVYADWLDEHGQPDRAELIRAQLRPPDVSGEEWTRFRQRYDELLESCAAPLGRSLRKKIDLRWEGGLASASVRADARLTAADVRKIAGLPHLTELLGIERLTPAELGHLRLCPNVRRLGLYHGGDLTPEQWEALGALSRLERLSLSYDEGRLGEGFRHVAALTGLKELDLEGRDVGDTEVSDLLPALTRLETLNLSRTLVSDAGLTCLPALARLRALSLHHTKITEATLERLTSLPLTSLDLGATQVQDPIACVLRFPRLRKVGLSELTQITDDTLPALLPLADLRELDLGLTSVTRFNLARLLERARWKKVRLEFDMGKTYEVDERESGAFEKFCEGLGVAIKVDWE